MLRIGIPRFTQVVLALRSGKPITSVMKEFGLQWSTVIQVALADPTVEKNRARQKAHQKREYINGHRQRLMEYVRDKIRVTRTMLLNEMRRTFNYLYKNDREWLDSEVSKFERMHKSTRDEALEKQIAIVARDLLKEDGEPSRVSKRRIVSALGRLGNCLRICMKRFSKATKALERWSEDIQEFRDRKITWAVSELAKSSRVIAVFDLGRKSGFSVKILREHRSAIERAAKAAGARILPER